ncbi:MAG: sigma-70 family RNA polymerase sigma factor [Planctomycetes bacterium]|nr:sigma-70 family RNA polymerase sigma factor [Planctomycetota bacterium]
MDTPHPRQTADATDAQLLAEFSSTHNEGAFAELDRRHGGMVLAVCRSTLSDAAEAQDAAQAVFLTLARKAHDRKARASTAGWLHRVAWHVAVRAARARATRRRHEMEAARMRHETQEQERDPIEFEALHAGLDRLPEKYRVPLILHHLEGHSQAQTASIIGCSVNALAVRLHRGRTMLRKLMERRGAAMGQAALVGPWILPSASQASPSFIAASAKLASSAAAGNVAHVAASDSVRMLSESAMRRLLWTKVKWLIYVGAVLLIGTAVRLAFVPPTVPPPSGAPPKSVIITGQVARISRQSLFIQRSTGSPVEIEFDSTTQMMLNDKVCTVADLQAGLDAAVYKADGQPALKILAYTPGSRTLGNQSSGVAPKSP